MLFCCCSGSTNKDSKINSIIKKNDSVMDDMVIKKSVYDSFIDTFGDYYRTEYESLPDCLGGIYDVDRYNFVIYVVGDLIDGKNF